MLTATQKQAAQSIINLFETGVVLGDYGNVTVITGDTGHLTFGRSQTTLGSGNLLDLLKRYCTNPGTHFGPRLAPWLLRFEATDLSLDTDTRLHNTLRATADDKVMRDIQDVFFDEVYWQSGRESRHGCRQHLAALTTIGDKPRIRNPLNDSFFWNQEQI